VFLNVHPPALIFKFRSCDLVSKGGYSLLEAHVMCIANTDMLASLLQDCASKGGFIDAGHNLSVPCKAYESSSSFLHHQTICCLLIAKVEQLKLQLTAWIDSESSFLGACLQFHVFGTKMIIVVADKLLMDLNPNKLFPGEIPIINAHIVSSSKVFASYPVGPLCCLDCLCVWFK
jgi:hypothetical protein